MKITTMAFLMSLLLPTFSFASTPELEFNETGFETIVQKVSQDTAELSEVQAYITGKYSMTNTDNLFSCGYIHNLSPEEAQQRDPQPWNDLGFLTLILKHNLQYPEGHESSGFVFSENVWQKIENYFVTP